ncbi:MAG TPA: DUF1015 domain-containing protein [Casimicrobiaceae bacterium]
MDARRCFRLPRLLLPRPGIDLARWAVIACDQHTSQPDYWREVERYVGDAPSTLRLIFPEVHLGAPDAQVRIDRIQATMRRYLRDGVLREHDGPVYVERAIGGRVRRGVLLELDLEQYDFGRDSTSAIRPTEGTMIERLAPRIAVRRGAAVEVPHILVLIDDPESTVIEPIGAQRQALSKLYETELMQGGGHVAGYAVDPSGSERLTNALHALADPQRFAQRYGVPAGTPVMLFAMGDGNHSLATAKSCWDDMKSSLPGGHPARFALVEIVNIHDPALDFAPIHRVLFGVSTDLRKAIADALGARVRFTDVASAAAMRDRVAASNGTHQAVGLIGPGARFAVADMADLPSALAVGTLQPILDRFVESGGARSIDYVHGDDVLAQLAAGDNAVGVHFPALGKQDLLRMVVKEGPLPRKTFSMGEANEKRYYVEARRIQPKETL